MGNKKRAAQAQPGSEAAQPFPPQLQAPDPDWRPASSEDEGDDGRKSTVEPKVPQQWGQLDDLALGNVAWGKQDARRHGVAQMEALDSLAGGSCGSEQRQQARGRSCESDMGAVAKHQPSYLLQADAGAGLPEKPFILFDLNGVLISERTSGAQKRSTWDVRPGIEAVQRLAERYRLGVFSSAKHYNVARGLEQVVQAIHAVAPASGPPVATNEPDGVTRHLVYRYGRGMRPGGASQLFSVLLCRTECQEDPTWRQRGGNPWDTVKPLGANGFPLGRVLLVDNEARKAAPGEADCMLLLPTWEHMPDKGMGTLAALVEGLMSLPDTGPSTDLRAHTAHINALIAAASPLPAAEPAGRALSIPQQPSAVPAHPDESLPVNASDRQGKGDGSGSVCSETPLQPARKLRRTGSGQDVQGAEGAMRAAAAVSRDGYLLHEDDNEKPRDDNGINDDDANALDLDESEASEGDDTGSGEVEVWEESESESESEGNDEFGGDGYPADALGAPSAGQGVGRKRGRELPGARPLYNGPRMKGDKGAKGHADAWPHRPALSALHYEIAEFAAAAAPSDEEIAHVEAAVSAVQDVARSLWPQSRAVLFGSQASGLALPGSDLDVVILGALDDVTSVKQLHAAASRAKQGLGKLVGRLKAAGLLCSWELVAAKVPIIKAAVRVDALRSDVPAMPVPPPGAPRVLKLDISMGAANGAAAVALMQRAVLALPPLRPLCLVVKALLKDAGLNEVFSGGLSSFSAFNMVLAHLQCEGLGASELSSVMEGIAADLAAVQAATRNGAADPSPMPSDQAQQASPAPDGFEPPASASDVQPDAAGQDGVQPLPSPAEGVPGALPSVRDFLRRVQEVAWQPPDVAGGGCDLGELLTALLCRYGHAFDWGSDCVTVRRGGVARLDLRGRFMPRKKGRQGGPSHLLMVEDPQTAGRDLCAGSFASPLVRVLLRAALQALGANSRADDPRHALPPFLTTKLGSLLVSKKPKAGRFRRQKVAAADEGMGPGFSGLGTPLAPWYRTVGLLARGLMRSVLKGRNGTVRMGSFKGRDVYQHLANSINKWPGWPGDDALLPSLPPAVPPSYAPPAHATAAPGSRTEHSAAQDAAVRGGPTSVPEASVRGEPKTEAELWAEVQRSGSHVSPAYHPAPLAQQTAASYAPGPSAWGEPRQWYPGLSRLFDVAAALGAAPPAPAAGLPWEGKKRNSDRAAGGPGDEPQHGMKLARSSTHKLNKREQRIRDAQLRRAAKRAEQKAAKRERLHAAAAHAAGQPPSTGTTGGNQGDGGGANGTDETPAPPPNPGDGGHDEQVPASATRKTQAMDEGAVADVSAAEPAAAVGHPVPAVSEAAPTTPAAPPAPGAGGSMGGQGRSSAAPAPINDPAALLASLGDFFSLKVKRLCKLAAHAAGVHKAQAKAAWAARDPATSVLLAAQQHLKDRGIHSGVELRTLRAAQQLHMAAAAGEARAHCFVLQSLLAPPRHAVPQAWPAQQPGSSAALPDPAGMELMPQGTQPNQQSQNHWPNQKQYKTKKHHRKHNVRPHHAIADDGRTDSTARDETAVRGGVHKRVGGSKRAGRKARE